MMSINAHIKQKATSKCQYHVDTGAWNICVTLDGLEWRLFVTIDSVVCITKENTCDRPLVQQRHRDLCAVHAVSFIRAIDR